VVDAPLPVAEPELDPRVGEPGMLEELERPADEGRIEHDDMQSSQPGPFEEHPWDVSEGESVDPCFRRVIRDPSGL
jgi:hypothetical protein